MTGAGAITATYLGFQIAQEELAIALLISALLLLVAFECSQVLTPEAALTGSLVVGYLVGSRGFAQFTPINGVPLLLGELGLVIAGGIILLRGALRRTLPIQTDTLNKLLLLWIVVGLARFPWDFMRHGLTAARDFATVYYAGFFFIGQALTNDTRAVHSLRKAFYFAFGVLPLTALATKFWPDFFLNEFTFRGIPLIFYKGDLLATSLFAGFLVLSHGSSTTKYAKLRRGLALVSLAIGLSELSRASIVGLVVGIGAVAYSRDWRPVRGLLLTLAVGLMALTGMAIFSDADFKQSKAYALYEHVASLVDLSGTRHYENQESADSGDNNRYRLVWWKTVTAETMEKSPLLGLGFGADLAQGFLAEYYPTGDEIFTVRSPHSILFTILGRTGLVGFAAWALFLAAQTRETWRTSRSAPRTSEDGEFALTLHAMCWVIMFAAFFGVVLEGPMGAIPFWTFLGLAHGLSRQTNGLSSTAPLPATSAGV